jgi:hypothetical protein
MLVPTIRGSGRKRVLIGRRVSRVGMGGELQGAHVGGI